MKRHFRRTLFVLLVCFALLLGLTACGAAPKATLPPTSAPEAEPSVPEAMEEPVQQPVEEPAEEPAPSEEAPPLGFPMPDWMSEQNAALEANRQYLLDNRDEVLGLLNQHLLSFREGSFEEMPNHHAPWPQDFPDPQNVNYPLTHRDYVVWLNYFEPIDENAYYEGDLSIWVRLDGQSHYMVLKPAWFGLADSDKTTLGFSDSRFSSEEPFFGFDDVLKLQNP